MKNHKNKTQIREPPFDEYPGSEHVTWMAVFLTGKLPLRSYILKPHSRRPRRTMNGERMEDDGDSRPPTII